jgi:hypothetical protein
MMMPVCLYCGRFFCYDEDAVVLFFLVDARTGASVIMEVLTVAVVSSTSSSFVIGIGHGQSPPFQSGTESRLDAFTEPAGEVGTVGRAVDHRVVTMMFLLVGNGHFPQTVADGRCFVVKAGTMATGDSAADPVGQVSVGLGAVDVVVIVFVVVLGAFGGRCGLTSTVAEAVADASTDPVRNVLPEGLALA